MQTYKDKQRHKLAKAIELGRIQKLTYCEYCLVSCNPDGHHWNYDLSLDVTWLCRQCHSNVHNPQVMERGRIYQVINREIEAGLIL